jgi:hypothetical protein
MIERSHQQPPQIPAKRNRMLQARLKAASFYAGPIDGIVGPKTRSGLLRLQAACANLKDLLETSPVDAQKFAANFG